MDAENDKRDAKQATNRRRPRLPKFRRRAEARKDEVLDAALELFTEKGYAATRVEDIATKAGISKGTVYLYFDSKEALMVGLIHRALSPIAVQMISTVDAMGVDPRLVLQTLGGLLARNIADPKVFAVPKLVLRESVQFPELTHIYRREVLDKVMPALRRLVEHQIRIGRFRPVDPDMTLRSFVGPLIAHLIMAEVFGIVPEGGLQMERFVSHHIDILMNGLSVEPEHKNG